VNSGAPEGLATTAPLVTPAVLLLSDTNIICYGNRVETSANNINTALNSFKTNRSKDEANIVFTRTS